MKDFADEPRTMPPHKSQGRSGRKKKSLCDSAATSADIGSSLIITPLKFLTVEPILRAKYACVTGGRAINGSPILYLPDRCFMEVTNQEHEQVLDYLTSLLSSQEVENLGLMLVVDRRQSRWSSVKEFIDNYNEAMPSFVSQVLILRPSSLLQNVMEIIKPVHHKPSTKPSNREKISLLNSLEELHRYIDWSQLTEDLGGSLPYDHEDWLEQVQAVDQLSKTCLEASTNLDTVSHFIQQLNQTPPPTPRTSPVTTTESSASTLSLITAIDQSTMLLPGRLTNKRASEASKELGGSVQSFVSASESKVNSPVRVVAESVGKGGGLSDEEGGVMRMIDSNGALGDSSRNKDADQSNTHRHRLDEDLNIKDLISRENISEEHFSDDGVTPSDVELRQKELLCTGAASESMRPVELSSDSEEILSQHSIINKQQPCASPEHKQPLISEQLAGRLLEARERQSDAVKRLNEAAECADKLNGRLRRPRASEVEEEEGRISQYRHMHLKIVQRWMMDLEDARRSFVELWSVCESKMRDKINRAKLDEKYDQVYPQLKKTVDDLILTPEYADSLMEAEIHIEDLKRFDAESFVIIEQAEEILNERKNLIGGSDSTNQIASSSVTHSTKEEISPETDKNITNETIKTSDETSESLSLDNESPVKESECLESKETEVLESGVEERPLSDESATTSSKESLGCSDTRLGGTLEEGVCPVGGATGLIDRWAVLKSCCVEYRRVLSDRFSTLDKSVQLHKLIEEANQWCSRGFDLLESLKGRDDKSLDIRSVGISRDEIDAFTISLDPLRGPCGEDFRTFYCEALTPATNVIVQDCMDQIDSVLSLCTERRRQLESLVQAALTPPPPHNKEKSVPIRDKSSRRSLNPTNQPQLNHRLVPRGYDTLEGGTIRRKRGHVIQELISTEKAYVEELKSVLQGYAEQWNNPSMKTPVPQKLTGKRPILFGNMDNIYEFHSTVFVQELVQCEESPSLVGPLFVKHRSQFMMYATYCLNKINADRLLAEVGQDNPFLAECQKSLGHRLPLSSYLLKPVQRITKYHLLLKELSKFSSMSACDQLKESITTMCDLLKYVNNIMHQQSITCYQDDFSGLGQLLMQGPLEVSVGRRKDKDKVVLPVGGSKVTQRHVFLYERAVMFCKKRESAGMASAGIMGLGKQPREIYVYKSLLRTDQIGLTVSPPGSDGRKFELWVQGRSDVFTLTAPNNTLKQEWVNDINRVLMGQFYHIRDSKRSRSLQTNDSVDTPSASDGSLDFILPHNNNNNSNNSATNSLSSNNRSSQHSQQSDC